MSREEIITVLNMLFNTVGLTPVKRSPVRLEVFDDHKHRVGELFFIQDSLDGLVYIAHDEYGDLFEGLTNGLRIGWMVGSGVLPIEA